MRALLWLAGLNRSLHSRLQSLKHWALHLAVAGLILLQIGAALWAVYSEAVLSWGEVGSIEQGGLPRAKRRR